MPPSIDLSIDGLGASRHLSTRTTGTRSDGSILGVTHEGPSNLSTRAPAAAGPSAPPIRASHCRQIERQSLSARRLVGDANHPGFIFHVRPVRVISTILMSILLASIWKERRHTLDEEGWGPEVQVGRRQIGARLRCEIRRRLRIRGRVVFYRPAPSGPSLGHPMGCAGSSPDTGLVTISVSVIGTQSDRN